MQAHNLVYRLVALDTLTYNHYVHISIALVSSHPVSLLAVDEHALLQANAPVPYLKSSYTVSATSYLVLPYTGTPCSSASTMCALSV